MTRMYGPAVRCKGFFVDLVGDGLASMYPASRWSVAPGHHGYQRACDLISGSASTKPFGSPVFAYAGKTDPPSSSQILSQTSTGEKVATSSIALLLLNSSFVRAGRRSFVPTCAWTTAPRAGTVKVGRHSALSTLRQRCQATP
jgi:hypothetical protein